MRWWLVPAFLLILVGLPLLAVVAARRLPPPRPRPLAGDFEWQLGRSYGLVGGDYLEVMRAVREGRAAAPERLQPAARALSEHVCGLDAFGRPLGRRLTGRQRAVRGAVWLALTSMLLVALLARHAYGAAIYAALYGAGYPLIAMVGLRRRRRAAQAAYQANAPGVADAATPTVR